MTLIIGIEDRKSGTVTVFGDRGLWRNGNYYSRTVHPKIWRDGDWIIGFTGILAHAQVAAELRLASEAPAERDMVAAIRAWAHECYRAIGSLEEARRMVDDDKTSMCPSFLVARGPYVFHVDAISAIRHQRRFLGIGAGWQYAAGAIEQSLDSHPHDSARNHGARAMRITARLCDAVLGPFDCLSTDGSGDTFE